MTKKKKKTPAKKPVKKKLKSSTKKPVATKKKLKKQTVKKQADQKLKSQKPATKKAPPKKTVDKQTKTSSTKKKRKTLSLAEQPGLSTEESKQWEKLTAKYKDEKATAYDMTKTFKSVSVIKHKEFGLGFVVSQYNHRLKVLFKEGMKILISNYKNK